MKKETLTIETDECGAVKYYNSDGRIHNPNGPAVVYPDGNKAYYINGELHNPDGPAVIHPNGYKEYFINGERHNANGPAIVGADGIKFYYIKGERLSETKFKAWQAKQSAPLHNKTATIDGIEYTLIAK